MRSMPVAMIWETLRRGRLNLITAALGANAVPCLLFTVLGREGALDAVDPIQIGMHIVFAQIYPFMFGLAALAAIGAPKRLYALPIRTSTLVALQFLLAMLLVAIETLGSTAALNAVFDLRWPLWGPVLYGAVAVVVLQATMSLADRSFWLAPAIAVPGGLLGLWFKAHYGPVFSRPTHYWNVVTPLDVLTLTLILAAAYGVAVVGVARNRRGESPLSIGFVDWLTRLLAEVPGRDVGFRTPAQAQLWFEWRKKGWSMPAIVIMGLVMGLGIWLIGIRDAKSLYEGFMAGGALFVLATLLGGFVLGHMGGRDGDTRIGPFLATRPMTTAVMAREILKCSARSLIFGWLIWAVSFLTVVCMLRAIGVGFSLKLPEPFGWWYVPATLVGSWAAFGLLGPLALTGRQRLAAGLIFGGISLLIGALLFSKLAFSREGQEQFARWGLVALAILSVAGTTAGFVAAHRRSLIGTSVVLTAASLWALASAIVALGGTFAGADQLIISFWAAGVLALAISPLATAPLALAWNRNR
jgi:hypothetical protein